MRILVLTAGWNSRCQRMHGSSRTNKIRSVQMLGEVRQL